MKKTRIMSDHDRIKYLLKQPKNTSKVSLFCFILFFWIVLSTEYVCSDNYEHVGGDWRNTSTHVYYKNELLCSYLQNDNIAKYTRSCIRVKKNECIVLKNNNGKFRKIIFHGNFF